MSTNIEHRTRLLFVRHGESDPGGRFSQHRCSGLTPLGVRQAAALAADLAASEPIDAVLASRSPRAIQTAAAVAEAAGLIVAEETCDLCEMHPGEAEGLTYAEMAERFGPNYGYVPGAEYFPDWLPNGVANLQGLAERYRGKTVVCATHNAVVAATFMAFGRMPHREVETIGTDNTGITEWFCSLDESDRRAGIWSIARHNDTGHLRALR
jgi:broad specificity phosphatase PhoE